MYIRSQREKVTHALKSKGHILGMQLRMVSTQAAYFRFGSESHAVSHHAKKGECISLAQNHSV